MASGCYRMAPDFERENILNGVSERNLCARLAFYLEQVKERAGLAGYHADPEYNRMQDGRIKLILDENGQEVSITCDPTGRHVMLSRWAELRQGTAYAMLKAC
jgi:hypothetical protein